MDFTPEDMLVYDGLRGRLFLEWRQLHIFSQRD